MKKIKNLIIIDMATDYFIKSQIIGHVQLGIHTSIYPVYNPIIRVGEHLIFEHQAGMT
jgi:hypothetical protein